MLDRHVRRLLLFCGLVVLASTLNCGREPTGPRGTVRARLAWEPVFPSVMSAVSGAAAAVPFEKVRIVLHRADGTVALDTTVSFPPGTDALPVTLEVQLSAAAGVSGEALTLDLSYLNAAGQEVFHGGPTSVTATPSGAAPLPAVQVPVRYTGTGASAAGVRISPRSLSLFGGDGFAFSAQAVDGSGAVIPGTPIVWSSLDGSLAAISSPSGGSGTTLEKAGSARIVAQLMTGPADTVVINLRLRPKTIEIFSGSGQIGTESKALAQPVVVKVSSIDGAGVSGIPVQFAAASGGGAVSAATVNTDAGGLAQTTWTLGATVGAQSLTAAASGLVGSPVTFSATARSVAPVKIGFVTQPPAAVAAGVAFGPVTVTAIDAQGAPTVAYTGNVTLALAGGAPTATLGGVLTVAAVAGVATFSNLTVNSVGSAYTLVASTATIGNATSTPFNVAAGLPATLVFGGYPVTGAPGGGVLDPISVLARDAVGNIVTSYAGVITLGLALNPPGATFSGTATATAVAGVATYTGIRLNKAGSYRFSAAASGIPTASGPLFDVVPGPAASIVLVKGSGQTAAALSLLDTIVVRVADLGGNPVSGSTVNFAVTGGAGSLSVASGVSNAIGEVRTRWTLGAAAGTQTMTATSAGLAGSPVAITATATSSVPSAVASTVVTPQRDTLTSLGDVFTLTAQALNVQASPVAGSFTWTSRNPAVTTVSVSGVVTAVTNGSTYVVATESGGTRDSALIVVQQRLATINVTPGTAAVFLGATLPFSASAVDGRGNALAVQPAITWSSLSPSTASVNGSGVVTGVALGGPLQIRATSGAVIGVGFVSVVTRIKRILVIRDSLGFAATDTFTMTALGRSRSYRAEARDSLNNLLSGMTFTWASTNGSVAVIDSSGPTTARATSAANGLTAIAATAQGATGSASLTVAQALASIELTPVTATIAITGSVQMVARGKDANNRYISGGAFTFASATPAVATVSAGGVVTGVTNGTSNLTAASGAITSNAAAITVGGTVPASISFGRDTLSVGRAAGVSIPILLSKPNATALTVNLAVADTFAFWSSATVVIPANQTSANATLNGRNAGTTTISALDGSGAGYNGDTAVLAVQATMRLTAGGYAANATDQVTTQVLLSDPSPAGGTYVTFGYSVAGVAAVSPDPAFIPVGQLAADIQIRGLSAGSTSITPSAIGVNGTASSFTSYAANLTLSTTFVRLGLGQYDPSPAYVYLPTNNNLALSVKLTSSDTTLVTVPTPVTIPANSYYAYFSVTGKARGTVTVTPSATGWTATNALTTVVTSPYLGVCCSTSYTTTSPQANFTVYAQDSVRTAHYRSSSLVVRLRSKDTTVMKVLDSVVTIAPGAYYNNAARIIPGGAGGSTYIVATAAGHLPDSASYTVIGPKLEFSWTTAQLGTGQYEQNVYVYAPNNVVTPLVVNLVSADSNRVATPTQVTIPAGSYYAYFTVRGKAPGSVSIIASAAGYQGDTASYLISSPRVVLGATATVNEFGPARAFTVYATDSVGTGHYRTAPLGVSFTSSDANVIQVDTGVTIGAGAYYTSAPTYRIIGAGTAKIYATAAGHGPDSATITVIAPKLNFSFTSTVVGRRQNLGANAFYVYTPDNRTTPLAVTLTQKRPAVDSLTATSLSVPTNSYYVYAGAAGLAFGTDTIIASAPGYIPDTAFVTVSSVRLTGGALPGSTTTTNPPVTVTVYATDSVGTGHNVLDTLVVRVVSSDPNVIQPQQAYYRILPGAYYVQPVINIVGPGTATLTFSDSGSTGYPSLASNAITVTGPSLAMSTGSSVIGMRQTTGPSGIYVYAPNNVGTALTVNLVSTSTRVATVPATVTIPAGSYYAYFTVTGQDTIGTIQIQATATGYNPTNTNVQVTQPRFVVSTAANLNTTAAPAAITVYAADANGTAHYVAESVTASLVSSAPGVANVDSTTVTIPVGTYYHNTARMIPGLVGATQLSATDPRATFYQYGTGTANIAVNTPNLAFSWSTTPLGIGQYIDNVYAYAPDNQVAPMVVTLTHTSRVSTPATVTIPTSSYYSYFRLIGASPGTDTLVASATSPAHNPATAYTVVDSGRVDPINSWPASLKAGDSVAVSFYVRDPSQNVRLSLNLTTWTLAPNSNIQFTSGGASSAVITSITIPANGQLTPTFYVKGVTAGAGSATISAANYKTYVAPVTVIP